MNLTPKQLRILDFIRTYRQTQGFSPTMQEIADEFEVSKVTVFAHVEALVTKGALERDANKARSLCPVDEPSEDGLSFPLVGRIAAGSPIARCADSGERHPGGAGRCRGGAS